MIAIIAPIPPPLGGMAIQAQALQQRIQQEGFAAEIIPTNPCLPRFFETIPGLRGGIKTAIYLMSLLRTIPRSAVVHVLAASYFYFFARVAPAVFLCRLFGRRVIVNYRGGEAARFFRRYGWLARPCLSVASALTVPSSFLKRCFEAQGLECSIVRNFVNLERFRFRERPRLRPKLIVTRSLEPMYNVEMALRAFQIVKEIYRDATLDIVGSGREEVTLKRIASQAHLDGVCFHGAIQHEQIPSFLERADVLLNPTNVDNFPMNLLEAFASGLAVVSTNAGGISDLLSGRNAAALVRPGDYRKMAESVLYLLNHPADAQSQILEARELAEQYSWEKIRDRMFEVYFPEPNRASVAAFNPEQK